MAMPNAFAENLPISLLEEQGLFPLVEPSKRKKLRLEVDHRGNGTRNRTLEPVPQDSFQEQARSPKLQKMHPEQMKQDPQVPMKGSNKNIKLTILTREFKRLRSITGRKKLGHKHHKEQETANLP